MIRIPVAAALALLFETAPCDRYVEVADGERLRVVDSGRGEPVVLIPGLLGSASTVPNAGHFLFEENPEAVAAAVDRAFATAAAASAGER